jgi:hypothetical protein
MITAATYRIDSISAAQRRAVCVAISEVLPSNCGGAAE